MHDSPRSSPLPRRLRRDPLRWFGPVRVTFRCDPSGVRPIRQAQTRAAKFAGAKRENDKASTEVCAHAEIHIVGRRCRRLPIAGNRWYCSAGFHLRLTPGVSVLAGRRLTGSFAESAGSRSRNAPRGPQAPENPLRWLSQRRFSLGQGSRIPHFSSLEDSARMKETSEPFGLTDETR